MNKKVLSIIIILCTIISVFIMTCYHNVNIGDNFISNKIKVFNNLKNKQQHNNNDNNIMRFSYLLNDITVSGINNNYKKNKLDEMGEKLEDDKKCFFMQDDKMDKKNVLSYDNKTLQSKKDNYEQTAVNAGQNKKMSEISNSNLQQNLTLADREKLLTISNKLSAIDYEKVKSYLQSNKPQDVKAAIKLLQERLTDNDYKEVKEIADKFTTAN